MRPSPLFLALGCAAGVALSETILLPAIHPGHSSEILDWGGSFLLALSLCWAGLFVAGSLSARRSASRGPKG